MENAKKRNKSLSLLLAAAMSVVLLFGATACNDNDNNGTDVTVEGDSPDVVVPDTGAESPSAPPSESPSAAE